MKILNTVIPLINNKQNTTSERPAAVSTASRPKEISQAESSFLIQLLLKRKTVKLTWRLPTCNLCDVSSQKQSSLYVKRPLSKRPKIGFQDLLSLNAGQKYCREHSAIYLTFVKLPFVIQIFVLSILSGRFTQVLLHISVIKR